MKESKKDSTDKLVADFIAQSITIEVYKAFFGLLPATLTLKCEEIAIKHLDKVGTGSIEMEALVEWRRAVVKDCAVAAREHRNKLLRENGYDDLATEIGDEDLDAPPKGKMN